MNSGKATFRLIRNMPILSQALRTRKEGAETTGGKFSLVEYPHERPTSKFCNENTTMR